MSADGQEVHSAQQRAGGGAPPSEGLVAPVKALVPLVGREAPPPKVDAPLRWDAAPPQTAAGTLTTVGEVHEAAEAPTPLPQPAVVEAPLSAAGELSTVAGKVKRVT